MVAYVAQDIYVLVVIFDHILENVKRIKKIYIVF